MQTIAKNRRAKMIKSLNKHESTKSINLWNMVFIWATIWSNNKSM